MSKLKWDQIGERLFETGVIRGVLFVQENGKYEKALRGTVLVKYQNHLLEQKRHRFMQTITSTLTCFPLKSMQEQLKHIHIRTNLPNVMVKVRCLKA